MRVLHVTPEYPPVIWGGLGTAVGGLVSASARAGLTVGVLLVGGVLVVGEHGYGGWQPISPEQPADTPWQTATDSGGVSFFHVAPGDAAEAGLRLAREWRPDVIHLHTAWLWPIARRIQEATEVPLVFTVHSLDRAEYLMAMGEFATDWATQEAVIAVADRVIALSRSERALIVECCPATRARIRIVGNGIDGPPEGEAAAQRDGRGDGAPLVLYSGRFVARKGIHELLAAIPRVLERAPATRFVLVGGYGSGEEIERHWLTDALRPYRSQVRFTGWLPPQDVAAWYRRADVLVVPSWYEPFGMVVLEGMLYELPICACGIGGPAEILEDGRTGLLVPPKDTEALTHALLRLVTDPGLRRRLGMAAAAEVRRRWLWPQIVEQMRLVYAEAVRARRR